MDLFTTCVLIIISLVLVLVPSGFIITDTDFSNQHVVITRNNGQTHERTQIVINRNKSVMSRDCAYACSCG